MRKILLLCGFAGVLLGAGAQGMDARFNYLKKYMGVNLMAGYSYQSFEHASLSRFASSFNEVFASTLGTPLSLPSGFQAPVLGVEVSAAAIRLGFIHRFSQPARFEAVYKNGSVRRMEIETPKNNFYFDLLMPMAKGRAYLGMTVGGDFGYYRLRSYLHNNFGVDTYINNDGVSGIYRSFLDFHGRIGARLDVHFTKRLSMGLRAELINKIIATPETAMDGWEDEFYVDARLSPPREWRKYMAEDVRQRHNEYVYLGNTLWESSPAINGSVHGMIYTATLNFQLLSFEKKK